MPEPTASVYETILLILGNVSSSLANLSSLAISPFGTSKTSGVNLSKASSICRSEERRVGKEVRSKRDWSSDVCSSDLNFQKRILLFLIQLRIRVECLNQLRQCMKQYF